jgi:hypothetical protein
VARAVVTAAEGTVVAKEVAVTVAVKEAEGREVGGGGGVKEGGRVVAEKEVVEMVVARVVEKAAVVMVAAREVVAKAAVTVVAEKVAGRAAAGRAAATARSEERRVGKERWRGRR